MSEESKKPAEVPWVVSIFRPGYKVARSTLKTLGRILSDTQQPVAAPPMAAPGPTGDAAISLSQVPELSEVGGVAKVETADHTTLGIARVGRNSFVGFKLDNAELAEVEVQYDDQNATLRISGGTQPPSETGTSA